MHNLFLVYFVNLYIFRSYLGLSSGGTNVCIQQLGLLVLLDDCLLSWLDWIPIYIHIPENARCHSKESSSRHLSLFPGGHIKRNVAGTDLDCSKQCVYGIYTFDTVYISNCGPGSSVDIATDYGLDGP